MYTISPFSPTALTDKDKLRRHLRQRRQQLTPRQRTLSEQRINRALKSIIKRGKRIAVYFPIGSELRLTEFVQAAQQRGAQVYLPYIESHHLRLWFTPHPQLSGSLKYQNTKLMCVQKNKTNKRSINIPQFSGKKIRAHQLHTLILPLVGLDAQGYRLGQGGGYYDCTLAACRHQLTPRLIAAAFTCQTVQKLPTETHDIRIPEWFGEQGCVRLPLQAT